MEKKAIIAIILTFLIIFLWGIIQSKLFPPPPSKAPSETKKVEPAPFEKQAEKEAGLREAKPLREEKQPLKKKFIPTKEISVETQNYIAVFTSEGGRTSLAINALSISF
jgi:YidC/Oxa1 family membrane protein insertase